MRFYEDRNAGRGIRLFVNQERTPGRPPPGDSLAWAVTVRQLGTSRTGRLKYVEVRYRGCPRRRFFRTDANRILRKVQKARADVDGSP